jgi:hypothetical protein
MPQPFDILFAPPGHRDEPKAAESPGLLGSGWSPILRPKPRTIAERPRHHWSPCPVCRAVLESGRRDLPILHPGVCGPEAER